MTYAELILAFSLLTNPNSMELESQHLQQQLPVLKFAILQTAIQMEILDAREARWMFLRVVDMPKEIRILQERYRELADAPLVNESYMFPRRNEINLLLNENRKYREYIKSRLPMEPAHTSRLRILLKEVDTLYKIWETVRESRCEYYYVTVRRQALKRLRTLVGEEAYLRGELPPHLPFWHFDKVQ